jgi:hypothetical protein
MMCAVTIRSIKPGAYGSFRQAWEPDPWPPQLQRVVVSRNAEEPEQILTVSYFDVGPDDLEAARDDIMILEVEEARLHRIAEHVERVVFKGIFEIAEEIEPPH